MFGQYLRFCFFGLLELIVTKHGMKVKKCLGTGLLVYSFQPVQFLYIYWPLGRKKSGAKNLKIPNPSRGLGFLSRSSSLPDHGFGGAVSYLEVAEGLGFGVGFGDLPDGSGSGLLAFGFAGFYGGVVSPVAGSGHPE